MIPGALLPTWLVMSAFFGFNSVLFRQYVVWFIPFIPLAVLEARDQPG